LLPPLHHARSITEQPLRNACCSLVSVTGDYLIDEFSSFKFNQELLVRAKVPTPFEFEYGSHC